jgi:hypothetical protein
LSSFFNYIFAVHIQFVVFWVYGSQVCKEA